MLTILFFALPITVGAEPIDEVRKYVEQYYAGELQDDWQNVETIDEIIDLLDPYSDYLTKEDMEQFTNSVNMTTVGIGVVVGQHEKGLLISDVLKNGSAEAAGLLTGDIITHVDGKSIAGLQTGEATAKIIGPEQTEVTITWLTTNGTEITKTLIRKAFSVPNVESDLLFGNIGYISLSSFSENAVQLVKDEIKALTNQGAASFIFDLRNNTGGYVTSAEQIIGLFPNARNAYAYTDASGSQIVRAQRQSIQFPENTPVLINGMSASASEMTAASLKDQNIATLYGETTYGKGTMQTFLPLSDGSYLKLTIAEFFGPNHSQIKEVGVKPHVETTTALATAHYETLISQYAQYNAIRALHKVPTSKTFTITFNKNISALESNSIQLVALGGQQVHITTQIKHNKVIVTPSEPLAAGGQYLLLFHPTIKGDAASLKKGSYMPITVKP